VSILKLFGNVYNDVREIQGFSQDEILEVKRELMKFKSENAEQTEINDYLKQNLSGEILQNYENYLIKIKDFYSLYIKTTEESDSIYVLNYYYLKSKLIEEIKVISTNLTNLKLNIRNTKRFLKSNSYLEEILAPCQSLLDLSNELSSDMEKSLERVKKRYNDDILIWTESNKIKNLVFQLNGLTENLELWEDLKEIYDYIEKKSEPLDKKKKKKKKEAIYTIHFNDLYNFYSGKYHDIIHVYVDLLYLLYRNKYIEEHREEEFVNVLERRDIAESLKKLIRTLTTELLKDSFKELLEELNEFDKKFKLIEDDSKINLKNILSQEFSLFLPSLVNYYFKGLEKDNQDKIDLITESDEIKNLLEDFSRKVKNLTSRIENIDAWILNIESFLKPYDNITNSLKQTTNNNISEIDRKREEFEYYLKTVKRERLRDNISNYVNERIASLNEIINEYENEASIIIREEFPQLKKIRGVLTNFREKILGVKEEVFKKLDSFKEKDIEMYQIIKIWEDNFNRKRQQLSFLISLLLNKIFKNFKELLEKEDELFEEISDITDQSEDFDGLPLNLAISDYIADKLSEDELKERIVEVDSRISLLSRQVSLFQAEKDKLEDILTTRVKLREGLLTSEVKCPVCHEFIKLAQYEIIKCVHCEAVFHRLCVGFWLEKYNACPVCQNNFVIPDSGLFEIDDNENE
jgi:hypothetical protein